VKISLRVEAGAVLRSFQNIRAEVPVVGEKTLETTLKRARRTLQVEPPERPGQRYIRTHRLVKSFVITRQKRGYKMENTAARKGRRYAVFPLGDGEGKNQAWMHAGRWLLYRDVIDFEMTKVPDSVEAQIKIVAAKNGMRA
jgi:hypothetical protein